MKVITTVREMQSICREIKKQGNSIGLVPTMGALHEGHFSLMEAARRENDFVVTSVFVNPTQFAPNEDLAAYPRTLEADCIAAEKAGVDALFAPSPEEMYPNGEGTWVDIQGHITQILCGQSRPTHFRGVTTVVAKLFHLSFADRAYFGQKDGQQALVIQRMVRDLFMPVEIRVMPIIRESDGLAKSSRNRYLSPSERKAALVLSQTLFQVKEMLQKDGGKKEEILQFIQQKIEKEPLAALEYAKMYSFPDLNEVEEPIHGSVFVALAVRIGKTRLIDNIVV